MSLTQVELRHGFDAFVDAAGKLQDSYEDLRVRADAVDLQLQATNQRLAQALAERDAIFSALPLGVVARRQDGGVTFRNDEAQRLCKAAQEHDVDLLALAAVGDVAFGEGAVRIQRVDLPEGELVLLEDRSHIQELEREVHRLDRLAGLSELALGVAHEIKNPLNGAMGFASLLERSTEMETARRHARRIREGLSCVDDIVKSLLAFARTDRGPVVATTVAAAAAEAAIAAGLPQARLHCRGDLDLRAEACALERVLAVLLRNAVEAGGDRTRVRIVARSMAGDLEMLVEDDGPGIAAEMAPRVFAPFVSSKASGTGLGLPLAARVLSFLGGDVALLNPGVPGARFRVRMPLLEPQPAAVEEASQ